jgi:parallel beta-helix repeat protein
MERKIAIFKILAVCALLGKFLRPDAFARDLYVNGNGNDSNTGSIMSPWRTITNAAKSVRAGDVVHVMPGIYNESVFVDVSGTATAPIRFVSDIRFGAQVRSVKTAYPTFQIRAGAYIEIVNFDVSGPGTMGIEVLTSNNKIIGNHVHDIPGGCPSTGGAGIHIVSTSGHDNLIDANVVHNIGNKTGRCMLTHGIYVSNARAVVTNNLAFANQGWGIHSWHVATRGTIANNTVFNNDAGGILVGAVSSEFPGGSGLNDYTVVENNIIVGNGKSGGYNGIYQSGAVGTHNRYTHNLLWQNYPSNGDTVSGTATGNFFADPQFVNYVPAGIGGDFHLRVTSPARGKGVAAAPTNPANNPGTAPDHDVEFKPRGSAWDLGAFKY